jgi:hypothetical protein
MSALDTQPGGDHYRNKAIQPVEYIHANNLGFLEGCIVKRITRWREKDGINDLEKIKHECDLLIELEAKKGPRPDFAGMIDLVKQMPDLNLKTGGTCAAAWGGLGK